MFRPSKSLIARKPQQFIDTLEARRLMSAVQINFTDFSDASHIIDNGFGSTSIQAANRLRMTDGTNSEARSAWFDTAVPIDSFRTDFSWRPQGNEPIADGMTFAIQNVGTNQVGGGGSNLGYGGISNCVAVCFNMYNGNNGGSGFGFASDGNTPITGADMSPIDLHSGHLFKATVRYDGTTLSIHVLDRSNGTDVFDDSEPLNIASIVGSHTAFVGFTAATGIQNVVQDVTSWAYSGSLAAPTVATAANATPNPAISNTAAFSVLGDDLAGESDLTYTWSLVRAPAGAATPTFSANASNGAKSMTTTFFKDGSYRFLCTITNGNGVSTTSPVLIDVHQTANAMRIAPHAQHVAKGGTISFLGTELDQFGRAMRTQPTIVYALNSGNAGSIDASTGLFTASGTQGGHIVVSASADNLTGLSGALVV